LVVAVVAAEKIGVAMAKSGSTLYAFNAR